MLETRNPELGTQHPIIWQPQTCDLCFGIGLRTAPTGRIEQCPTLQLGHDHCELSLAGRRIVRSVEILRRQRIEPDVRHFDIARSLAKFSTDRPCSAQELHERHFAYISSPEARRREVTRAVRFLRDTWLLPVGSRKDKPAGYWIITDEQDFKAWVDRKLREPIAFLTTIRRLAKHNWPEFAEQMELDVWKDFNPSADADDDIARTVS